MAAKSRLGRGLGALFPALPGEQIKQPVAHPESEPTTTVTPTVSSKAGKTTVQEQPAKRASQQPSAAATAPVKSSTKVDEHHEGNEGVVSPLSTTIPSMGTMSRNADTVSMLSRPMTLQPQAAEHRLVAPKTDTDTNSPAKSAQRATMPAIDDMSHPSDVFFDGRPVLTNADLERAGIAPAPSASTHSANIDDQHKSADTPTLKPVEGGYLVELHLADIGPNLHQPRNVFDETELQELANSIREVGVLQPIVVRERPAEQIAQARKNMADETARVERVAAQAQHDETAELHFEDRLDSKYELVMGERRWRASQIAGFDTIPAIVKTTADDYMLRDALLENLHRVALNPLEEAAAYQQMIDEFGLTQMQLAKSVSKSRPQIANTLRLMNLPSSIQKDVIAGKLSAGHARALLGLSSDKEMEELAKRIIDEGLSVRSVEEIVSMKSAESDAPKKPKANRHNPWASSPIPQHLSSHFDTKVSIKGSQKHGRIEIVFSSPEEMDRIIGMLMPNEA